MTRDTESHNSPPASSFTRWATYRQPVPLRTQIVIVLLFLLVTMGFALWAQHQLNKTRDAKINEMMARAHPNGT